MRKVLVIDDSKFFQQEIKFQLRQRGYDVILADDAYQGVELAKREKPDIIILDLVMPEVDGLVACLKLKSNPKTKNIPVIICTSYSNIANAEKAIGSGAIGFISKPIDIEILDAKIRKILRGE